MDIRNNSSVSKLCLLNILYTLVRSQQSRLANHVTERSWRWSSFSIICPMCVILDYFREFILCNSLFSKILSLYPLLFLIIYGYYYLIAKICYKLVHGKNLLQRTKQRQCRLFVTIIIFFIKNRHKTQRKAKFYLNNWRSVFCMQDGLKQALA